MKWREEMRERARAYFARLAAMGLARMQRHRLAGRTFINVTIEGTNFRGQVYDQPYVVTLHPPRLCPLNNACISICADGVAGTRAPRYAICKNRTQPQIWLTGLSDAGIRALACEFGLLIDDEAQAQALCESDCFEVSKAHAALLDWTERQPALAKRRLHAFPVYLERLKPGRSRYRRLEEFPGFASTD